MNGHFIWFQFCECVRCAQLSFLLKSSLNSTSVIFAQHCICIDMLALFDHVYEVSLSLTKYPFVHFLVEQGQSK